jgi:hypothetical protein
VADRPWLYGRAVENGGTPEARLRFASVSRISGADPAEGGCLRAWHFEMVGGKKRPKTKASTRGDNLHDEIEKYLKTGDRSLSSLALSGLHMVPDPGPDLLVEHDLCLRPLDKHPHDGLDLRDPAQKQLAETCAAELLAAAPLTADGVPVLGRMDLVHGRGTNKGGVNIDEVADPPNTVEVYDWKSTGNPDYIKKPRELPGLIQMAGYAEWVYRVEPAAEQVRLSHGYFVERGGPSRKVSLRVVRGDVARTWEHAEGVVRSMKDAAREQDPDRVPANLEACGRFGGCPHREYCGARMHRALADFVGATMADKLLGRQRENQEMGLFDKMKAQAGQAASAPPPAATTTAAETSVNIGGIGALLGAPSGPTPDQVAAEKAKLAAEEAAQRAAAQLRAAADRVPPGPRQARGLRDREPGGRHADPGRRPRRRVLCLQGQVARVRPGRRLRQARRR